MKDAREAGLLGGGGVGFLLASGRARPWTDRAAALRGCPGSPSGAWVLLASRWPRSGAAASCATSCASDEAASEPTGGGKARVVAASAPPIGPPRHHHAHPICIQPPMCPMENPGLAPLGRICVFVCVGVHGGLGLPEAGSRSGGRARGHLRVRALLGGVRVAGQRTRGEDGRGGAAREPHKNVGLVCTDTL